FYRDHRKLLVVVKALAVLGGTGVPDEFWEPDKDVSQWHEVMEEITGPLVLDWQALFNRQLHANDRPFAWSPNETFGLDHLP
ncbi:phosphatidylserine/phosphatidylglycerophosphate/cardiolipin synthase family protein, partial [Pseudomonas syringae pv. tagetis]